MRAWPARRAQEHRHRQREARIYSTHSSSADTPAQARPKTRPRGCYTVECQPSARGLACTKIVDLTAMRQPASQRGRRAQMSATLLECMGVAFKRRTSVEEGKLHADSSMATIPHPCQHAYITCCLTICG
jgi:hypothetical protein